MLNIQKKKKFNGVALNLHEDLPFLPERKKIEKFIKLVCSIEDKKKYVVHIRALKQALSHELILKKVHRVETIHRYEY